MKQLLTIAMIISCWSVIMYEYLPVWQLVAAFNVISIATIIVLETVGKEIKDEICRRYDL